MLYLSNIVKRYPKSYELIKESYQNGGKLLVCGNGGSATDSGHIFIR